MANGHYVVQNESQPTVINISPTLVHYAGENSLFQLTGYRGNWQKSV